jgi:hypothetical protein
MRRNVGGQITYPSAPVPNVMRSMLGPRMDLKSLSTRFRCFRFRLPWIMSYLRFALRRSAAARSRVFFHEEKTMLVGNFVSYACVESEKLTICVQARIGCRAGVVEVLWGIEM